MVLFFVYIKVFSLTSFLLTHCSFIGKLLERVVCNHWLHFFISYLVFNPFSWVFIFMFSHHQRFPYCKAQWPLLCPFGLSEACDRVDLPSFLEHFSGGPGFYDTTFSWPGFSFLASLAGFLFVELAFNFEELEDVQVLGQPPSC